MIGTHFGLGALEADCVFGVYRDGAPDPFAVTRLLVVDEDSPEPSSPSTRRFVGFAMWRAYLDAPPDGTRRTDSIPVGRQPRHTPTVWAVSARILVIDNYDSFVYNLVQYLGELGAEPVVYRDDAITTE